MKVISITIFASILFFVSTKVSGAEQHEHDEPFFKTGDSVYVVVRAKGYMPFVSEPAREIAQVFQKIGINPGIPNAELLRKYPDYDYKKGYPAIPRIGTKWRGTADFLADVNVETLHGVTKRTVKIKGPIQKGPKPRIILGNVGEISVSVNHSQMIVSVNSESKSKRIAVCMTIYQITDSDELWLRGIILDEGIGTLSEGKINIPGIEVEKKESYSLLLRKSFNDAKSKIEKALLALKLKE